MTGYSNPFASGPIVNDQAQYRAFAASGTVVLTWPSQGYSTDTSLAWIMDITPASGAIIEMPDATLASNGVTITINNVGTNTLDVRKNDGSTSITTVASGVIKQIYLTDNTTTNGTWRVYTLGAGTAATDISSAAGLGLLALASTLNVAMDTVDIAATPYTVSSADRFRLLKNTIGTITLPLPAVASVGAQFVFSVANAGTGTMELIANGSETIDGEARITLQQTEAFFVVADAGTNTWQTVGRGLQSANSYSYGTIATNGGSTTLNTTQRAFSIQRFTGTLASNATIDYGAVVGVWFVSNDTSGAYSLTLTAGGLDPGVAIAQGTKSIIVNTGSAVYVAITVLNNPGTVTSIIGGTGLSGGTITSTGTFAIADTAVTPGAYGIGAANSGIPSITVDQQGRLTSTTIANFVATLGASGSMKIPTSAGTAILNWGSSVTDVSGVDTVTFTTPFVTSDYIVQATVSFAGANTSILSVGTVTTTQATIYSSNSTTGSALASVGYYWFAVGK